MPIWTEASPADAAYAVPNAGQTRWDDGGTAWDAAPGNVARTRWDLSPRTWGATESTAADWTEA